ncbi:S1C family serine protease [Acidovorax sp. RAC01]|uniref:S1C family serine protease n=1 Tax=Acidovorax sp. RAC01 TaxID=1842533 RepID=UPI00083E8B69|nr:trypsin-like peptidase domain-containing protein [Acidovorax sp. RAC01]AOG23107.1 trypsin family protein [Acidovorax sp. RAC01]
MSRPALYSSSRLRAGRPQQAPADALPPPSAAAAPTATSQSEDATPARSGSPSGIVISRRQMHGLVATLALLTALVVASAWMRHPTAPRAITQEDIDAAVLRTLQTTVPPSAAARAIEAIGPSVVRVAGFSRGKNGKEDVERGVGTGVVVVDKGIILTNLHVVTGADRITVTFHDGLETSATITGAQPENDLAVLRAHKVPDDLQAAPLRSTHGLRPGDHVVAVGFPFGIGPSASAGVVSGLEREFTSPEGKRQLSNLIQFDAAANPGNSGGPLITLDGEVVGIVTAILNPTPARTFIGIGFAVPIENAASAVGMSPF